MFEQASKLKLRYKVANGIISTEDLWDLSLENLDKLAIQLNKEVTESKEQSFIQKKTDANKALELKFDIVKHVINFKLAELEAKKVKAEKRAKKQLLLDILEKKENESLSNKSIEELKAELAAIDE